MTLFRFLVVTADGDSLGITEFQHENISRGDTFAQGREILRVLDVLDAGELAGRAGLPAHADDVPVLVVDCIRL